MKQFEKPEIDVMKLAAEDIITTSEEEVPMPSVEQFCV